MDIYCHFIRTQTHKSTGEFDKFSVWEFRYSFFGRVKFINYLNVING